MKKHTEDLVNDKEVLEKEMKELVEKSVDDRISKYRERLKYFLYGLLCLLAVIVTFDFASRKEILREAHKLMFPVEVPVQMPASYSGTFVLKPIDTKQRSAMMPFYCGRRQDAQILVNVNYRFDNPNKHVPVIIRVDNSSLDIAPTKFTSINDKLQGADLHYIGFSVQPGKGFDDLSQEITITCIVHVTGEK